MRRTPFFLLILVLVAVAGGCRKGPSEAPEHFAMTVAGAVANGHWDAYKALALEQAKNLSQDSNPVGSRSTFSRWLRSTKRACAVFMLSGSFLVPLLSILRPPRAVFSSILARHSLCYPPVKVQVCNG